MKISEVSKLYNIESHTLRYYEKEGFLGKVEKNKSNQRDYNVTNLVRIDMVLKLRSAVMNISAIKEYIEMSSQGNSTIIKRKAILELRMEELDEQILMLQKSRAFLAEKVSIYDKLLLENNFPLT